MTGPTLFQRILSGELPSGMVARGDGWGAFLDIQPRRRGHVLVVPEQPAMRLAELDRDQQQALMEGVTVVQSKLTSIFGTKDFSIVIHDGPQAGQEVPHVHIHVIPRTSGDGGLALPAMWPRGSESVTQEELSDLAERLQDA